MKLLNKQQLIEAKRLYFEKFKSLNDVANILQVKYNDLRKSFKINNIKSRKTQEYNWVTNLEQEKDIIKDYLSGISLRKLETKYNVSRSVISRVLSNNNIKFRNVQEANDKNKYDKQKAIELFNLGYSYNKIANELDVTTTTISKFLKSKNLISLFSKKVKNKPLGSKSSRILDQNFIISQYYNGKSCAQIAKILHSHHQAIAEVLKQNNVKIKTGSEINRKYDIDELYFKNIHYSNKYTTLGILFTDGSNIIKNGKYCIGVELQAQDKHILDALANEFKTIKPHFYNNKKDTFKFYITNKILSMDLATLGCLSPKTYNLTFPTWVKDELFKDFLHGCIIGDGWIYRNKTVDLALGIVGTESMVKEIQKRLNSLYNIQGCISKVHNSNSNFLWNFSTSLFSAVLICNKMFENAPFVMKRKYEAYKSFVEEKANIINNIRYSEDRDIIREAVGVIKSLEERKIIGII